MTKIKAKTNSKKKHKRKVKKSKDNKKVIEKVKVEKAKAESDVEALTPELPVDSELVELIKRRALIQAELQKEVTKPIENKTNTTKRETKKDTNVIILKKNLKTDKNSSRNDKQEKHIENKVDKAPYKSKDIKQHYPYSKYDQQFKNRSSRKDFPPSKYERYGSRHLHDDENHRKPYNNTDDSRKRKSYKSFHDKEIPLKRRNNIDTQKKESHIETIANISSDDSLDEDEEQIIEKQRKKREEFLRKLNASKNNTSDSKVQENDSVSSCQSANTIDIKEKTMLAEIIKKRDDETRSKSCDMFSEHDNFNHAPAEKQRVNNSLAEDCDDEEGYYLMRIGETLDNRYSVTGAAGKGVFSNVLRATDSSHKRDVAIKVIRNNDLMRKTGKRELDILKKINEADEDNKYHCLRLIRSFTHKNHLCMVLEPLAMNLREVLKRYGKHIGIDIKVIRSYSHQLLLALKLLKKVGVIHADIKPDNILVNESKSCLKLCDFGSALRPENNEPTPYLVSRYYRAPEIILGLTYGHEIDMWSTACTIFELATGRILFSGTSNNTMLKYFIDLKGKIPNRMIRKGAFKEKHFTENFTFLHVEKDKVTDTEKVVEIINPKPTRDIYIELQKSQNAVKPEKKRKLNQLHDMLEKMLVLDPMHRATISSCMSQSFLVEKTV